MGCIEPYLCGVQTFSEPPPRVLGIACSLCPTRPGFNVLISSAPPLVLQAYAWASVLHFILLQILHFIVLQIVKQLLNRDEGFCCGLMEGMSELTLSHREVSGCVKSCWSGPTHRPSGRSETPHQKHCHMRCYYRPPTASLLLMQTYTKKDICKNTKHLMQDL